jgi:hypothetical protein
MKLLLSEVSTPTTVFTERGEGSQNEMLVKS